MPASAFAGLGVSEAGTRPVTKRTHVRFLYKALAHKVPYSTFARIGRASMPTTPSASMEVIPATIRLIKHELLPKASPRAQRAYLQVVRVLERAQRDIERRRKRGELLSMSMGIPA